MKAIVFSVPDPHEGADNPLTRFCDNPAIKVRSISVIPPYNQQECRGGVILDVSHDARIMISYEALADDDRMQQIARYEQIALKRLARISKTIDEKRYRTKKNEAQRILYLQAFHGLSKAEAEVVSELFKEPEVILKLLEGD